MECEDLGWCITVGISSQSIKPHVLCESLREIKTKTKQMWVNRNANVSTNIVDLNKKSPVESQKKSEINQNVNSFFDCKSALSMFVLSISSNRVDHRWIFLMFFSAPMFN